MAPPRSPPRPLVTVTANLLEAIARRGEHKVRSTLYDTRESCDLGVVDYLNRLVRYAEVSDIDILRAMVYIDRVCVSTHLEITTRNVHRLLLAAIVSAHKYAAERPFGMSHLAKCGGVETQDMLRLERKFIQDLEWCFEVDRPTAENYFAKFRQHPQYAAATGQLRRG
eukprot:TRINITY_DN5282_c0_g1_i1.p1 TRINITY_DN5282_c0_g1~~TRINITY_DN5282_c0_g1_i1.p1  ORF type:complete len:188 (+),score=28.58 TRINITY_DN5282_c0_g1_i1:63-566(+)